MHRKTFMSNWFVSENEIIKGPLSLDQIQSDLSEGRISLDALIWAKGHSDWFKASEWSSKSKIQINEFKIKTDELWHYTLRGQSKGPMTRQQLIQDLKSVTQKDEVLVWTKGMKAWVDLFDMNDLVVDIGLNRREHPRAPIDGQVVITTSSGLSLVAHLKMISIGGIGTEALSALSLGEVVDLEIKSGSLGESIMARATVQYIDENSPTGSSMGLKFTNLSTENKGRIMQYVLRCTEQNREKQTA